ncbi:MAG: glycosyltransferase family 4 protein [Bacteroidales bacterium]
MLNNEYPPLGGGTGTVNQAILQGFVQHLDIKIDLITTTIDKEKKVTLLSDNVRIFFLPLGIKNIHHASNSELIKYAIKAFFLAFQLNKKEKYDFSMAWSTLPAGFVSWLLKKTLRLSYIIRVGGPDIPGFEERYTKIYKLLGLVIRKSWKNAEFIIAKCNTEMVMINSFQPNLKTGLIYNGVNTNLFYPVQKKVNTPLRMICPARLIKRKGQDLLIKALSNLKNNGIILQLDLVGEGDEKENFIKLAKELSVNELINFKGYIPRENMPETYHGADFFVLPSYNEGMSNALLEAMACGLTPVVTDVGGTRELVKNGENGFVFSPGDLMGLTSILSEIAKNPEILGRMGSKSAEMASRLDWKGIVNEYINVFNAFKTTLV